jgi:hypothetical protein
MPPETLIALSFREEDLEGQPARKLAARSDNPRRSSPARFVFCLDQPKLRAGATP